MSKVVSENANLITEVRMWLALSKLFYRAFQIRRLLGPSWFVVNLLLEPFPQHEGGDPSISFKEILDSLPADADKRSSKHHDLSACLDDLRDLRHLDVFENGKPTTLAGRSSFPVQGTSVKIRPKILNATHRYIRSVLREWYGLEYTDALRANFKQIMADLYELGSKKFLTAWGSALTSLANASPIRARNMRDAFADQMKGSTEYFVLLFSLWEMSLIDEDDEGYKREMLLSLHLSTRHVEDNTLEQCVDQLIRHVVVEEMHHEDEETHYRLAKKHQKVFESFGNQLLPLRGQLRLKIDAG